MSQEMQLSCKDLEGSQESGLPLCFRALVKDTREAKDSWPLYPL